VERNLHIVFSQVPEGVSDEDFNRWYDAHLVEILAVPSFVSARRYRLDPVVTDHGAPSGFGYLAVYEVEGDPAAAIEELESVGFGSKDSYADLKEVEAGDLDLPDWWDRARFASWNCVSLGERVEPRS
jgi:hypothetical protein